MSALQQFFDDPLLANFRAQCLHENFSSQQENIVKFMRAREEWLDDPQDRDYKMLVALFGRCISDQKSETQVLAAFFADPDKRLSHISDHEKKLFWGLLFKTMMHMEISDEDKMLVKEEIQQEIMDQFVASESDLLALIIGCSNVD